MALRAGNSAQLLHLLLLLLLSTCFLLLPLSLDAQETNNNSAVPAAASLPPAFFFSFNFSNVSSYDSRDLYFEGNASARSNLVDLTCSSFGQDISDCTGRMSYKHPVPLYDDTTVASFSTSFTFVIQQVDDKDNSTNLGEGIAFFLSGYQSSLPPDSDGDGLGLLDYNVPAASGAGQFVAVEFNSFYGYIGININSATSSNQTDLPSGQEANGTWIATINFNNITAMLVASFRSVNNATTKPVEVRYDLQDNIKTLLPPEVEVGFSASTGDSPSVELNQILAWSFNSTLAAPPTPHKGHEKTILIIVGVLALVLLVLVIWFALSCWKWRNRHRLGFQKQRKQEPTRFEYRDLAAATDHFSEGETAATLLSLFVGVGRTKTTGSSLSMN